MALILVFLAVDDHQEIPEFLALSVLVKKSVFFFFAASRLATPADKFPLLNTPELYCRPCRDVNNRQLTPESGVALFWGGCGGACVIWLDNPTVFWGFRDN